MLSEGSLSVLEQLDCYIFVGGNFYIGYEEHNSQHLLLLDILYFGNLGSYCEKSQVLLICVSLD